MKILIVARGYLSIKGNQYGIFEYDQAKALANAGHEVYMLGLDIRSIRHIRKYGIFETEKEGIRIINASFPYSGLPVSMMDELAKGLLRRAYKVMKHKYGTPDVIHAHFFDYAFYTVSAMKGYADVPIVVTEHSSKLNQDNLNKEIYEKACEIYQNADRVICVSNALAKRISIHFAIESVVIPNIVDTGIFQYVERAKGKTEFTFISVANLIPLKRMDRLIKAFAKVLEKDQDLRLIIVGDGIEKSKIEYMIHKYGLQEKVLLTGRISREQINGYFKVADCFVLPSSSETFGVSYIEAMATGLPVIATRCGGPEDFVDDSNGILIDVDDARQLYEAMQKMIRIQSKFNAKKIAAEITERFSKKRIVEQIEVEYRKVRR